MAGIDPAEAQEAAEAAGREAQEAAEAEMPQIPSDDSPVSGESNDAATWGDQDWTSGSDFDLDLGEW